jgi:uncharacterized protein (TIGR00369 family)
MTKPNYCGCANRNGGGAVLNSDKLVAFFEQQIPFNRHLGIKVVSVKKGECMIKVPFQQDWIGDPHRPALHGGVLSTVADAAGGLAVFSVLADPMADRASTVDLRIDYLRRGLLEDVYCRAKVLRVGNRVAVTEMVCLQGEHRDYVAAECRAVYNIHRAQQ